MKKGTINPQIGGYFKHKERVYKAIAAKEFGCAGCCFWEQLDNGTHICDIPVRINCNHKIIKDVTGSEELKGVELIDTPYLETRSILPVLIFFLAFWTIALTLIFK